MLGPAALFIMCSRTLDAVILDDMHTLLTDIAAIPADMHTLLTDIAAFLPIYMRFLPIL